jgi:dTMP kinase
MNPHLKGCFIVFEGLDGSGKSTQVGELETKLQNMKYEVITTREPTKKSAIGGIIERILYNHTEVPDEVLALLFAADRTFHTINTIRPALERGLIVVSDRYVYSSLAYQSRGMNKKLDVEWLKIINQEAIEPDMVVFLDISPEEGELRLIEGQKRVQDHNFFEKVEKQTRIREGYYEIFDFNKLENFIQDNNIKFDNGVKISKLNNTEILKIDATLPVKEIREIVGKHVSVLIKKKNLERIVKKQENNGNLKAFFTISKKSNSEKREKKQKVSVLNTLNTDTNLEK